MSMKIIEILQKEAIGADLKKDAADAGRGLAKGVNAFISGASGGKVDIGGTIGKYGGDTTKGIMKKLAGKDADIGSRGIGAESGLGEILKSMYGENLPDKIKSDWEDAIRSGDENKIKAVNDKYENEPGIRPQAQSETNPGKLKPSHRNRLYALAGLSSERL